jgi:hypothetical protein
LSALGYAGARRSIRQLRGTTGKPWPLLVALIALAAVTGLQVPALRHAGERGAPDPALLDPVLRFGPLVLPFVLLTSTFSTPLRLSAAEVSWVLIAPGGARALVARALLLRPLAYAAIAFTGASAARVLAGRPLEEAWTIALAGAVIALALRVVAFGGHILTVRARAAWPLRALAVIWGAALLTAAATDVPGGDVIALRPLFEPLAAGVLGPTRLDVAGLLVAAGALLAVALTIVAAVRGVEERAQVAARRFAEVQASLRNLHSEQPQRPTSFGTALPSLPGWSALAGERAFMFRALAQQRRMSPPTWVAGGFLLDLAAPLVALALVPGLTAGWAVVGLVGAAWSGGSMLAVEVDHFHLRAAPVRPLPALMWLGSVTAVHRLIGLQIAWLPVVLAPGVTLGAWVAGVVIIPGLVALAEGAGALAVGVAERSIVRAGLKAALGLAGLLPAAASLTVAMSLGAPAAFAAVPATVALTAAAAAGLAGAAKRVF